ncbi:hypothetical protein NEIMUCOT_04539 [Neisseria mucosa ATCC 25996]|uniref:Uncharacterized protein n=1 Tax=Neisseria mucosa (strain ATCC 25996 / DSM 4631 / NCTC 10774 / M26) TaxID=546266 RepID=D2ZV97_NEIM2|nr:hypothetical protein NEIMUCOT_04539 [Neisseria mucosa ATCC 25996]
MIIGSGHGLPFSANVKVALSVITTTTATFGRPLFNGSMAF